MDKRELCYKEQIKDYTVVKIWKMVKINFKV